MITCPTTTLPCIKECKEGECALKDPFGFFNKLSERHYAENFINFLLYKGLNLQNGKFYFFKNGLGQAFSIDEILDLYMEEKRTPAK